MATSFHVRRSGPAASLAHAHTRGKDPLAKVCRWARCPHLERGQFEQGLAFGHRAVLADQPFADAASLLGDDGYMHLHGFDDANLGVDLDAVADLDQAGDEVSGHRRGNVTRHAAWLGSIFCLRTGACLPSLGKARARCSRAELHGGVATTEGDNLAKKEEGAQRAPFASEKRRSRRKLKPLRVHRQDRAARSPDPKPSRYSAAPPSPPAASCAVYR